MSSDQARQIAERIAKRVATPAAVPRSVVSGDISSELAAMRASLGELQNRLVQIESRIESKLRSGAIYSEGVAAPRMHSPWLAGVNANHPSEERFGVEEATVSQMVDYFQSEKTCSMEPGGKPCDHCSMCSSRGF